MAFKNKFKSSFLVNRFADSTDNESNIASTMKKRNLSFGKHILKIRTSFAAAAENSPTAVFISYIYRALLDCPLSVISVFLGVFSLVCFFVHFIIAESKTVFLLSNTSIITIILLIISALTFPVKRDIATLFNQSVIFSRFRIAYDRRFLNIVNNYEKLRIGYSTAFFLGVLCGIMTLLFSAASVLFFVLLITFFIVTINRPECGILSISFFVPFLREKYLVALIYGTFISLLYKYFLGKRHISFGVSEYLLFACAFMFLSSGIFNITGFGGMFEASKLLSAVFVFICVKNLIKSTSLLKCCIDLISSSSIIVTLLIIVRFLLINFLPSNTYSQLISLGTVNYIFNDFLSTLFVPVFIAATLPLNLSILISKQRNFFRSFYLIIVIAQLFCVLMFNDIRVTVTLAVCCTVVFAMKKVLVLFATPFIMVFVYFLQRFISGFAARLSMFNVDNSSTVALNTVTKQIIKDNFAFGIGIGKKNFSQVLSQYAFMGSESVSHPHNTFESMLISFGVFGTAFLLLTVSFLLVRSFKMCIYNKRKPAILNTAGAGIFASGIFSCITMFAFFVEANFTVLFALFIALSFSIKKCMDYEYIESNQIR